MSEKNKRNIFLLIGSMIFSALNRPAAFAAQGYTGPVTDHFDGEKFYNRVNSDFSLVDLLRFTLPFNFIKEAWPEWIEGTPRKIPRPRQTGDEISVTFINHSTLLIQVDGVNILTDPIFSERSSSLSWAGPKRVRSPGVNMEDLPPVDVILVSHNHYDHLDIESLKLLQARNPENQPPLVLSGLGNGRLFEEIGLTQFKDLDWNQSASYGNVEFVFTETRHRSGRGLTDLNKSLWGGFVIKTRLGNIYFAGDTAYGPHFAEARKTHGDFILSLLPIGAYEPRWFMKVAHMNPKDAVAAHLDLKSKKSLGIHFGTFQLTYEGIDQPLIDLKKALKDQRIPDSEFIVPDFGETRVFNTP
ncbi:MAG: MBL fold metallo-hydrolase [Desulfosalsimonadaceae bacterium]